MQSTALMAIPSLLIGVLPTYHHIGIAATWALVLMRMLQGFALGGQLSGSYVLMVESAPSDSRGFYGALVSAAASCGAALASGAVALASSVLTTDQMASWGWRLPFVLGGVLAPISVASALWCAPHHHGVDVETAAAPGSEAPYTIVFGRELGRLVLFIGCIAGSAAGYYFKVWLLTYLTTLENVVSYRDAAVVSTVTLLVELPIYPLCGWAADSFAKSSGQDPHTLRGNFLRGGQAFLCVYAPLMAWWLQVSGSSLAVVLVSQLIWAGALGFASGNLAAFEVEVWMDEPSAVYTGVALGHSIAMVLFGGLVPTVATALFDASWAPPAAPFLYLSAICALSLVCHHIRSRQSLNPEDQISSGAGNNTTKQSHSGEAEPLLSA